MNATPPADTYDPAYCQLPFPVAGTRLEKYREEVIRLRALSISVMEAWGQIIKDKEEAERSAFCNTGWTIQSEYLKPLEKLEKADQQLPFLLPEEREHIGARFTITATLIKFWENPEILESDKALLTKYAKAIKAEPRDVTPRSADEDDDRFYDYTPVIELGLQANEQPAEVTA